MFCPNCGKETPDHSTFCSHCGYKLDAQMPSGQEEPKIPPFSENNQMPDHRKQGTKKIFVLIGAGIAVIAVIVAAVIFFAGRPMTVRLNDYVTFSFTGYNTAGYASADFDRQAFYKDYAGKIKYEAPEGYGEMDDNTICEMFLNACVYGQLNETSDLSNGDEVQYIWSCNDSAADTQFHVKLSYKDMTEKVEGLEEPEEVDPFEHVEMVYSGTAPYGSASVNVNGDEDYLYDISFEVSPSSGLSNGDTVTVTASGYSGDDALLGSYGVTLSNTESSFTVEGLAKYVTSLEEVSDDALAQMQAQSEDVIRADEARGNAENVTLDNLTYMGSYLLSAKNPDSVYGAFDMLYMVYRKDLTFHYDEEGFTDTLSCYYTVRFDDLTVSGGTVSVDLMNYTETSASFDYSVQYGEETYETDGYYVNGYETLDDAFNECVAVNMDIYNYQSSIEEVSESE